MENDYEDGQWIGGEFYGKPRQKRAHTKDDDVLFGVFASSTTSDDSDSGSKKKKRKRTKGQSNNTDFSKPVNFVSTGDKPTLDENAPNKADDFFLPTALGKKIQEGVKKRSREKLSSERKEALDTNNSVGEFEKHTKGIGMKLMEKMGYKGGGLGKNQQGITAPIETKLRPKNMGMGFNHFKEEAVRPASKPAPLSSHASEEVPSPNWLKRNAVKKKAKPPVYTTVEQLLNQKQEPGFVVDKVFDMRGPQVRVLTNLKNKKKNLNDEEIPMPELQHNIGLIVDLAELEIQKLDRDLRNERETVVALHKEKEKLHNDARRHNQQLEKMEVIVSVLDRINELRSSGSLTLESLAELFVDLQTRFPDEYTMHNLPCIACDYALPLLVRIFQGWDPLQNPTHGVEVVSVWRKLLQGDESDSSSPYMNLLMKVVFPAVRRCAWSARDPEPMIRFLECLEELLPPAMLQLILDTVIVPKISAAVDSWDPCRETIPIHSWVHPWLPLLQGRNNNKLEFCFDTISRKLSSVLHAWKPSDVSAYYMLSPWKNVFNPATWEQIMVRHIVPKLRTVMHELQINPGDQNLDQFYMVRTWVTAIPTPHMLLLMDTFFNKWEQVLYHWLCSSEPNLLEVTEWYLGWKQQLPPELQGFEHIRLRLKFGLYMMNQAAEGKEVPPPAALRESIIREQRQFETKQPKKAAATEKPQRFSFKEVIEMHAQQNGLTFLPKPGRMQDGHQMYEFGKISIIADSLSRKVFAQNDKRYWSMVSLDQLLDLHNAI